MKLETLFVGAVEIVTKGTPVNPDVAHAVNTFLITAFETGAEELTQDWQDLKDAFGADDE